MADRTRSSAMMMSDIACLCPLSTRSPMREHPSMLRTRRRSGRWPGIGPC